MLDRVIYSAAQVHGLSLMQKHEFGAAAAALKAVLALPCIPTSSVLSLEPGLCNQCHAEDGATIPFPETSTVLGPCPIFSRWLPSGEGSEETVVLETRLLLAIALQRGDDPREGFLALRQLASQPSRLAPRSALHHEVFVRLAKLSLCLGKVDDLKIGLAACKQVLVPLVECDPWDAAQLYDLEAALHVASCQCADGARCACDSLEQARASTEAAISLCSKDIENKTGRKQQVSRELSLRQLHLRLGLVDVLAEEAAAVEVEERRERKQRHKSRRQDRAARCLDDLTKLAPQIPAHRHVLVGLCAPLDSGLHELRLDWDQVPAVLQPSSNEVGGLAHDPRRVERKRWQLESLFVAFSYVLARHRVGRGTGVDAAKGIAVQDLGSQLDQKRLDIVDFGAGSGNSVLAIAALCPGFHFTLVEAHGIPVAISKRRVADAGLQNVTVWHGDAANYPESFDVGLATHLCGEGTDLAQAKCIEHRAAFVLTPCCLGNIKHVIRGDFRNQGVPENIRSKPLDCDSQLQYPRSAWLRQEMGISEYLDLVRLCDCNSIGADCNPGAYENAAVTSKELLDADRLALAVEAGYETHCGKLWPEDASRKNDVLVGWPLDAR
ncbi:unnamed protein product [Polarella glacialis]|uniref:Methyltransferase domain-containing protein n=1 Tax=Polarella glacialis TaxID=89957 RepID=A0A813GMD0_POLGL|nr:unnamed protein product [Polarella glacialis]